MLRGLMRRLENEYGTEYNDLRRARSLLLSVAIIFVVVTVVTLLQSTFEGVLPNTGSETALWVRFAIWQVGAVVSLVLLFRGQLLPATLAHAALMAVGVGIGLGSGWFTLGSGAIIFLIAAAFYMRSTDMLILTGAYALAAAAPLITGVQEAAVTLSNLLVTIVAGVMLAVVAGQMKAAFVRAERRTESLGLLLEIGQEMTTVLALDDLLPKVLGRIRDEFDLDRLRVALLRDEAGEFVQRIAVNGRKVDASPEAIDMEQDELLKTTYRERGKTLRITETRSRGAFPMMAGRTMVGVLLVEKAKPVAYSDREVTSLQTFANQLALAVENTNQMGSESAILEATSPVFRATQEIATVLSADDILGVLRRLIVPDVDHISLITVGFGSAGEPVTDVLAAWDRDGLEFDADFPEEVRMHIGSRQMIVTDASTLEDDDAVIRDYARHMLRARAFFVNPLKVRDRTVGYLLVAHYTPHEFSERDIRTLETISGPIGVVLDNLTLLEALSDQAERLGDINDLALDAVNTNDLKELGEAAEKSLKKVFDLTYFSFTTNMRGSNAEMVTFTEGRTSVADFIEQRGGDLPRREFSLTGTSIEEATENRRSIHRDVIPRPDLDTWVPDYAHSILVVPLAGGGSLNLGFGIEQIIETKDIELVEQMGAIFNAVLEKNLYLESITRSLDDATASYSLSLALNAAESLYEIYETALFELANATDAQRIILFIAGPEPRDGEVDYVLQAAMLDHGRLVIDEKPARYGIEDAPVISQFPESRANLVFNNAANDPRLSENIRDSFALRNVNSAMLIPLATGNLWLGAVLAEQYGESTFTSDGLRRSRSIADQTALAIDSQMLLERFQTTVARERALREVAERIRSATDREEVLQIASNEVSQVIGLTEDEAQAITTRTTQRQGLDRADRALIDSITNQVDLAIQNLTLLEAAEQAAFREQLINEMTVDLQSAVSVDEVMQTAVRMLTSSLAGYKVRVKLDEREESALHSRGDTGPLISDEGA